MNELVQLTFDYSVLTQDQAQRTQAAEIRIVGRTQKAIIDNGRDLSAVKADIGHGHFLNWLRYLGISEDTAERWMNVASNFSEIPHRAEFESRALYLLSVSKVPESAREEAKQRAEDGEKITEDVARKIRDAHKAKEQAEESERQAQARVKQLSKQIEELQQQEISPKAQEKINKLTEQRNNLSEKVKELGEEARQAATATPISRQRCCWARICPCSMSPSGWVSMSRKRS
jgi:replicative superfamily II helicase